MVSIALVLTVLDAGFVVALFGWWLWPLLIGGALGVRWLRTRTG